jgi:hypothetical protein
MLTNVGFLLPPIGRLENAYLLLWGPWAKDGGCTYLRIHYAVCSFNLRSLID